MADMNSQAFWNEFMRRPEAREAYQEERRIEQKKQDWLHAKYALEEQGAKRQLVAAALEHAPADIKKLIAPIFHIRLVAQFLWIILDECGRTSMSFVEKLRDQRTLAHLQKLREQFHEGGEERLGSLEKQWHSVCNEMAAEEEKKTEQKPISIDVHNLKHVLEFGQECKRLGNEKFRECLYEEALQIYSQGDDMMKKWKVDDHLKNEHKWLKDYHLACLKNKAQAALKLELFATALDAAEAALVLDVEDHKAWYRKVMAQKSLGRFDEAEASLARLEDVAQWCPDRRSILNDCEAERKRIHQARVKHRLNTQEMLGKAFDAGVFGADRDKADLEAIAQQAAATAAEREEEKIRRPIQPPQALERQVVLTPALAGDLLDDLAEAYGQQWFQERVQKCGRDSNFDRYVFLSRLRGIAFEVQRPILEKWGFDPSEQGVREMTAAVRDHGGKGGKSGPAWLKEKQDRCLELVYGGREEGGMASLLMQ